MEWLRPLIGLTVRTLMGVLIGGTFGFLGVGIGWGSFVFFGARSGDTLLLFFIGGASVGVAGGVFLAWLNLDGNSAGRLIVMGSLLLLAAAGVSSFLHASIAAWSRSQITQRAPSRKRRCTVAKPIPRAPPVTKAVFPCKLI